MNARKTIFSLLLLLFTVVLSYGQDDVYDALVNHHHVGIMLSNGDIIYGRALDQTGAIFPFKEDSTGFVYYYQISDLQNAEVINYHDYASSDYNPNRYQNGYSGTRLRVVHNERFERAEHHEHHEHSGHH